MIVKTLNNCCSSNSSIPGKFTWFLVMFKTKESKKEKTFLSIEMVIDNKITFEMCYKIVQKLGVKQFIQY